MTQEVAILERLSERACYLDKIGAECKLRLKAARQSRIPWLSLRPRVYSIPVLWLAWKGRRRAMSR